MPDLFMHLVRLKLNATIPIERTQEIVNAVNEIHAEIRQLEMMRAYYADRAKDLVQSSAREADLFVRLRSAGAAVVCQDIVADLDYRINRMKDVQKKIPVALGS